MAEEVSFVTKDVNASIDLSTQKIKQLTQALKALSSGNGASKYLSNLSSTFDQLSQSASKISKRMGDGSWFGMDSDLQKFYASFNTMKAIDTEDSRAQLDALASSVGNLTTIEDFAKSHLSGTFTEMFGQESISGQIALIGELGDKYDEVSSRLSSTTVDNLQKQVESLSTDLNEAKSQLDTMSSSRVGQLVADLREATEQAERLQTDIQYLREQAGDEFKSFLRGNGIDFDEITQSGSEAGYDIQRIYDRIIDEDYGWTAQDAITRFKSIHSELLGATSEGLDSTAVKSFAENLDLILSKISTLEAKLESLPTEFVNKQLMNGLSQSGEFTETQSDMMAELASTSGAMNSVASLFSELSNIAASGSDASLVVSEINQLVSSLSSLAEVDDSNLYSLSSVFSNISNINGLEVDANQVRSLYNALEKLTQLDGLDNLRAIGRLNLSGLTNLNGDSIRISSTINSQLVPFLQSAATFDVDQINKLASINFSGLQALSSDNFKVSKASMENLKNLVTYNSQLNENNTGFTGLSEQLQPVITNLQSWSTTFTDSFSTGLSGLSTQLQSIITILQSGLTISPDSLSAGLEAVKAAAQSVGATLTQAATDAQTAAQAMQEAGDSASDASNKMAKFKSPSISNTSAVKEFESIGAKIEVFKSRMMELQTLNKASAANFGTQIVDFSGASGAIGELEMLQESMGDASGLKANYSTYLQALQKVEDELTIAKRKLTEFETAAKSSMGEQVSDSKITKAYDTIGQKIDELEAKRDKLSAEAENSGVEDFDVSSVDAYISKLRELQNLGSKEAFGKQFSDYTTAISQANAELDTLDAKLDLAKSKIKADDTAPTGKQLTTAWDTLGQKIDEYEAKLQKFNLDASNAGIENFDTSKLQGYVALLKQVQRYGKDAFEGNWASYSKYIAQANAELTKLTAKLAAAKSQKKADEISTSQTTDFTKSLSESEARAQELQEVLSTLGTGEEVQGLIQKLKEVQEYLQVIKDGFSNGSMGLDVAKSNLTEQNTSMSDISSSMQPMLAKLAEEKVAVQKAQASAVKYINSASKSIETELSKQQTNKTFLSNESSFKEWSSYVNAASDAISALQDRMAEDPMYINTTNGQTDLLKIQYLMGQVDTTWKTTCENITRESNSVSFKTLQAKVQAFADKYGDALSKQQPQIYKDLLDLQEKMNTGGYTTQNASKVFSQIQAQASSAGVTVETLGQKIKAVLGNRLSYMGTGMVFMKVRQLASTMLSNVRDIDSEMAQLQIVTGASDSQMTQFFDSASEAAQRLGASVTDVMSSVETFSRLGYNMEESMSFAENSTILSNVADTSVDEATTGLTSIVKGFNLEPEAATQVADELVAVGQSYAISASELMEAFENGGSSLSAAGNTLEESMAIFAAGNASVQDASTVGTAMKTMAARIRSSTAELDDMGKIICSAA